MKFRAFIRQLLGNDVYCPWCEERLDLNIKTLGGISSVLLTMIHARYCKEYRGSLHRSIELWTPEPYSVSHYQPLEWRLPSYIRFEGGVGDSRSGRHRRSYGLPHDVQNEIVQEKPSVPTLAISNA